MQSRVAIYTRISKDLQHEGLGVGRQLADCRKYAQDPGYEVIRELEDNDAGAQVSVFDFRGIGAGETSQSVLDHSAIDPTDLDCLS